MPTTAKAGCSKMKSMTMLHQFANANPRRRALSGRNSKDRIYGRQNDVRIILSSIILSLLNTKLTSQLNQRVAAGEHFVDLHVFFHAM